MRCQEMRATERGRGRRARGPLEIPWRGWKDIALRTYQETQDDRLLALAAASPSTRWWRCSRPSPQACHNKENGSFGRCNGLLHNWRTLTLTAGTCRGPFTRLVALFAHWRERSTLLTTSSLGASCRTTGWIRRMSEMTNKSEEQKDAEAEVERFRKDLGPFVVAAETTRMAMVFTDAKAPDNPIIFANDSFLSLTGYDREEVLGQNFSFLLARGADPEALAQLEAEFEGSSDSASENHYRRKDGSEFWAATFISPVRTESGDVVQHFASFADLTKHKQEQAYSRMLIDELNHRVKNTLATVQSI
jgi:PAS domain S-box-containing protein